MESAGIAVHGVKLPISDRIVDALDSIEQLKRCSSNQICCSTLRLCIFVIYKIEPSDFESRALAPSCEFVGVRLSHLAGNA